jgi:hypothetical protein
MHFKHSSVNGEEISNEAIKCITKKLNIPLNQLDSDGAPSIAGKSIHAVTFLKQSSGNKIRKHQCIMQTEASCSVIQFQHLMSTVAAAGNYIQNNGLKHNNPSTASGG